MDGRQHRTISRRTEPIRLEKAGRHLKCRFKCWDSGMSGRRRCAQSGRTADAAGVDRSEGGEKQQRLKGSRSAGDGEYQRREQASPNQCVGNTACKVDSAHRPLSTGCKTDAGRIPFLVVGFDWINATWALSRVCIMTAGMEGETVAAQPAFTYTNGSPIYVKNFQMPYQAPH